jgi:hypothetical protein
MLEINKRTSYKTICVKGKQYRLHRYIMAQSLGRELSANEIVHHADNDKKNNNLTGTDLLVER